MCSITLKKENYKFPQSNQVQKPIILGAKVIRISLLNKQSPLTNWCSVTRDSMPIKYPLFSILELLSQDQHALYSKIQSVAHQNFKINKRKERKKREKNIQWVSRAMTILIKKSICGLPLQLLSHYHSKLYCILEKVGTTYSKGPHSFLRR